MLKELEAEHFFALNLQSRTYQRYLWDFASSLQRPTLQCTFSQAHRICALCTAEYSLTARYFRGWRFLLQATVGMGTAVHSAQCHKGPHKQRDREQAQRELESVKKVKQNCVQNWAKAENCAKLRHYGGKGKKIWNGTKSTLPWYDVTSKTLKVTEKSKLTKLL